MVDLLSGFSVVAQLAGGRVPAALPLSGEEGGGNGDEEAAQRGERAAEPGGEEPGHATPRRFWKA